MIWQRDEVNKDWEVNNYRIMTIWMDKASKDLEDICRINKIWLMIIQKPGLP